MISAFDVAINNHRLEPSFFQIVKKTIVIILSALTILAIISHTGNWLGKPTTDAVKFDRLQNIDPKGPNTLPFSQITGTNSNGAYFEGTIALDLKKEFRVPALFVPYYDGELTLWLDEEVIKKSTTLEAQQSSVSRLSSYLIPLENDKLHQAKTLTFTIKDSANSESASFLSLSPVYIGEYENLSALAFRKKIFEDVFRPAVLVTLLTSLFVFLLLGLAGKLGSEALPIITLIIVMAMITVGSLAFIWPKLHNIHRYAHLLTPLGVAAVNSFVSVLVSNKLLNRDRLINVIAIIITFLGLIINTTDTLNFSITAYNAIVSIPILLIGLILVGIRAAILSEFSKNLELSAVATILLLWVSTISLDALGRLGFVEISLPLTNISMLILFITMGFIFASNVLEARNNLASSNKEMLKALHEQSLLLKNAFEKETKLREENILARNYERIYDDLHDGVLTYLFSIKAIGETSLGLHGNKVSTLAQFCLNEIRVILSSGVSGSTPLILSLSNLRHNVFDSLPDIGVETEWDVTPLLAMSPTDLRFNLEVVRVLQEAVHNAVERANCSKLCIFATLNEDETICFRILNYGGNTFCKDSDEGFGLKSMKARIHRLGGKFAIMPAAGGAVLSFEVPIPTTSLPQE